MRRPGSGCATNWAMHWELCGREGAPPPPLLTTAHPSPCNRSGWDDLARDDVNVIVANPKTGASRLPLELHC